MINKTQAFKSIFLRVTLTAMKDYFDATDEGKKVILKELRDDYNTSKTDNWSAYAAYKLEKHPEKIAKNLKKLSALEKFKKISTEEALVMLLAE